MSFLKNLVKKAGKAVSKAKNVLLPIAGVAVGLALPGIGGVVGGAISKIGGKAGGVISKVSEVTGIGDGKPGIFGVGTGKAIEGLLKGKKGADGEKGNAGASASANVSAGGAQPDEQEAGIPGWVKAAGLLGLFLATR